MTLDPVLVGFRDQMRDQMGDVASGETPTEADIIAFRDKLASAVATFTAGAPPREDVRIENTDAGGVPIRLYRPDGLAGPLPLHAYYHGGAFMMGSALSEIQDAELAERAAVAGSLVASVEYRLAPEHRFPAGVEDSYSALAHLAEHADEYGIDGEMVTVGGGSSGGNFAAVVACMCKERGGPRLALQLLEIAGTDLTKSSSAWRNPAEGHDITREADLQMIDLYLSSVAERVHRFASPLFYPDLAGVAPAYVMSAEFDPRRDECEAYVARLQDAGVKAIAQTMTGHVHGSMLIPDWPPALAWREEANGVLAKVHARLFEWPAP